MKGHGGDIRHHHPADAGGRFDTLWPILRDVIRAGDTYAIDPQLSRDAGHARRIPVPTAARHTPLPSAGRPNGLAMRGVLLSGKLWESGLGKPNQPQF